MKLISPKYDYFIKEMFRDPLILRHFIGDVLGIPQEQIRTVRLKNTFLWKRYKKQKQGILDVLAELNDDTKINIELQVKVYDSWDKRQLFYLSKMYTEDLQTGHDYSLLRKCVGISILNFNLSERKKYHTVYYLMDSEGYKLTDMLEVHVVELKKDLTGQGEIDDWIRFFNVETEEDLKMIKTKNPGIVQAIGLLQRLSLNNPIRLRYEAYLKEMRDERAWKMHVWKEAMSEGVAQGVAQGMAQGKAEGMAQGKAEGMAQGVAQSILDSLQIKGDIPEMLRAEILAEKDMEKLRFWLRLAVQCQSPEEFQSNLHAPGWQAHHHT